MKPIEPGCRVMYVGSVPAKWGMLGTADEYIVRGEESHDDFDSGPADEDGWIVTWDRPFKSKLLKYEGIVGHKRLMAEKVLMRIDGDVDEECEADEISRVKEFA